MSEPTIVDVLENALDGDLTTEGVQRLSLPDIRGLRETVLQFYESWASYPPEDGVLRAHLGGWIASAFQGIARDLLHAALLYAHEVVVYDPVAAYFEPNRRRLRTFPPVQGVDLHTDASTATQERKNGYWMWEDNLEAHRSHLGLAVAQVGALAPLIRTGAALPIPHLKLTLQRQEAIWSAVRHLMRDDQYTAVLDNPIDRPALSQDFGLQVRILTHPRSTEDARIQAYGDAAYYLARSLAMADVAYSRYLPPSATEWAVYQQRLRQLAQTLTTKERLELTMAPALLQSDLPYFTNLPAADLLAARRDEASFGHWRAALRNAARQISAPPSEGEVFANEARDVLQDHLDEPAAEARRAVSRSAVLRRSTRANALALATGAVGVAATGAGAAALGGVGISGALRWLFDTLFPSRELSGTNAVLAHLVHGRALSDLEDDGWPARDGVILQRKT